MSVQIAGEYMSRTLNDFARGCAVSIEEEQEKLAPDTQLISLLCDAIRLTREMARLAQQPLPLRILFHLEETTE